MARPGRALRLFGIPLIIHPSWLLAAGLIIVAVGSDPLLLGPQGSHLGPYIGGIAVAALLFGSVLLHELAHALAARRCAIPVRRITMYLFGGSADIDPEALSPRAEALAAAAGPLASGGATAIFAAGWWLARGTGGVLEVGLQLLALANGAIALLTILPGYPLDGGRVVRALAWYLTDDLLTATRLASLYGQALAFILLVGGLALLAAESNPAWGLGLLLCGWFLRAEARRGYHQLLWRELSKRLPTYHATFLRPPRIPAGRPLSEAVDEVLDGLGVQNEGGPSVVVDGAGEIVGVVGLDQLRAVKRARWATTPAAAAMVPRAATPTIPQDLSLAAALERLPERGHGYGLVVGAGQGDDAPPIGVVTRARIDRLLLRRLREGRGALDDRRAAGEERRIPRP